MPVDTGNVVELVIAALGGGGLVEVIRAIANRRKMRVDSTSTLNDSTLKWAEALQRESDDSRREALEARREAQEAWQLFRDYRREMEVEMRQLVSEMHKHRQMAETLTYRFRLIITAIMSPNVSVESLRELVQDPSFGGYDHNGTRD